MPYGRMLGKPDSKQILVVVFNPQWWRVNSPQVKRGLFNFIGQASHFLSGTATSEEIDNVKETLQQIGNNQAKLAHDITRFKSVLNHTYEEIEITRKQLNSSTTTFELYVAVMDKNLRGIAEQVYRWTHCQDIEILISHLEDMTCNFLASHNHWINRKENVEAGQLNEHILPPGVLKTILATEAPPLSTAVEPLQWYCENTFIKLYGRISPWCIR